MRRNMNLVLTLGAFAAATAYGQPPSIAPVPDPIELDPLRVVERYGQPDFAVSNLLVFRRSFAGLPADVTFFVSDGSVSELSFAFPVEDRDAEALRRDADRVLKRLRTLYGSPSGTVRTAGEFKSHVWRAELGEMLHTVVYTPDREEHTLLVARRSDSPGASTMERTAGEEPQEDLQ